MKILFTHRYYWPDTAPYALMLRSIATHFARQGADVHVFSSKLSYRDVSNADDQGDDGAIAVKCCWVFNEKTRNPVLRVINVLLYCVGLFFHVLRTKPDVVTASTFPPVVAGWSASLAARMVGAKFVYHMMDIHPEVSELSGGVLGRAPLANILRWLDNQTLRRAEAVVVLSKDMQATLEQRGLLDLPISVINNFMLESSDADVAPVEFQKPAGKTRIIFAGNLGRFQNLDALAEGIAMSLDANPDLELMFMGDGARKGALIQKWGDHPQIKFAPFLPFAQAKLIIKQADLGIVSLQPDIYRVAYPSKVLSYLGMGLPILALVEPDSVLAQDLVANDLGVVAQDSTPQGTRAAVQAFLDNPIDASNIQTWYAENASVDHVLRQWQDVISGLDEG